MSLDLTVLRLLKRRDRCDRLARAVPKQVLDPQTARLLAAADTAARQLAPTFTHLACRSSLSCYLVLPGDDDNDDGFA